jgi:hypothetical protein
MPSPHNDVYREQNAEYVRHPHGADLYNLGYEGGGVLPTCHCGWEGIEVPTYDGAAEAYAQHRLEAAQNDRSGTDSE